MHLSDVRINLCDRGAGRLKAFCVLTFDHAFVVRDVKLIEREDGIFLAMPSRKLTDHCPHCGEKNHLRAAYCNECGKRLSRGRERAVPFNGSTGRVKLHADIAHPINARCRQDLELQVLAAYEAEIERSRQPGYVPPSLDGEDYDLYDTGRPAMGGIALRA